MIRNRLVWCGSLFCILGLGLVGCGDDDHDHDGHDHSGGDKSCMAAEACGDQANCGQTETLMSGLVVAGEGYEVMVHMHDELSGDLDNQWMIMLRDGSGAMQPNKSLTVSTYSEDCCHAGPTAPQEVTTDAMGMATIEPTFAHGGPWSVRFDVDSDAAEGEQEVIMQFCVPGASHADLDHGSSHGTAGDGAHDMHSGS